MRRLIWPVLFLFLMLLQGSVSVYMTGWLSCDLLLLAIYAFSIQRGPEAGAVAGGLMGFFQDALSVSTFGYYMLTRAVFGYLVGMTKEKVFKDNFLYHMSAIATCSLILRFVYWWVALIRADGRWNIFFSYCWDTLGFVLGNVLLVWPVVLLVKLVYEWIKKEDISY